MGVPIGSFPRMLREPFQAVHSLSLVDIYPYIDIYI